MTNIKIEDLKPSSNELIPLSNIELDIVTGGGWLARLVGAVVGYIIGGLVGAIIGGSVRRDLSPNPTIFNGNGNLTSGDEGYSFDSPTGGGN